MVIVTYNGTPWLRRCLDSLAPATTGPVVEVVVVDNASTDETCRVIEQDYPHVVLIRSAENLGFGRGNNLGISQALARGARHVFLLNQDAYLLPSTPAELTAFIEPHPALRAASPPPPRPRPAPPQPRPPPAPPPRHAPP
ncbi:glycosyltransferase, partial [Nostoc sp. NIES-2111]